MPCDHRFVWLCRRRGRTVLYCERCLSLGTIPDERIREIVGETTIDSGVPVESLKRLLYFANRQAQQSMGYLRRSEVHVDFLLCQVEEGERLIQWAHEIGLDPADNLPDLLASLAAVRRRLSRVQASGVMADADALLPAAQALLSNSQASQQTLHSAASFIESVLQQAREVRAHLPELAEIQSEIAARIRREHIHADA